MEVTCTEFMYLFSTALVCVLTSVAGQGCLNQGNECFTHSACCGGCCRTGICVESTRNCQLDIGDCVNYCPPRMSCTLFQVPGCTGCPIIPYCREEGHHVPGDRS
ncbi:uncharacterized protein LOC128996110 isoform X1 [Macrosteles quadrilineatus]|uniref:uncharacterized protein LOC128996110 isoform X1 n=1 Tax=Macrosteles quadrilineatus TaxID=74068 RepID=UPI0023E1C578|nr:uncharacterized protein LOC128996110 isoform X1 [Macrosteles quadrilineatus]